MQLLHFFGVTATGQYLIMSPGKIFPQIMTIVDKTLMYIFYYFFGEYKLDTYFMVIKFTSIEQIDLSHYKKKIDMILNRKYYYMGIIYGKNKKLIQF